MSQNRTKILLTGASGFIGQNFIKQLGNKFQITALVRPHSNITKLNQCQIFHFDGDDEKALVKLFKDETFDCVVHLATFYKSNHSPEDLKKILNANITFGTQVLEAMRTNPPKIFINVLTFSQFTHLENYSPLNLYDASKQAFADIIEFYRYQLPTNFAHLLLYNTYGSDDSRPKIFNLWKKNAQNLSPLEMSSGKQEIDISHINDVIKGFDILMTNIFSKQNFDANIIYTLENFPRYNLKDLANIFEKASGLRLNLLWGAKSDRKNEIYNPISSLISKKFQKLPHWNPQISLQEGIKSVFGNKTKMTGVNT